MNGLRKTEDIQLPVNCKNRSMRHELCSDAIPSKPCGNKMTKPFAYIHLADDGEKMCSVDFLAVHFQMAFYTYIHQTQ